MKSKIKGWLISSGHSVNDRGRSRTPLKLHHQIFAPRGPRGAKSPKQIQLIIFLALSAFLEPFGAMYSLRGDRKYYAAQ
jgi:hypothetical protein